MKPDPEFASQSDEDDSLSSLADPAVESIDLMYPMNLNQRRVSVTRLLSKLRWTLISMIAIVMRQTSFRCDRSGRSPFRGR